MKPELPICFEVFNRYGRVEVIQEKLSLQYIFFKTGISRRTGGQYFTRLGIFRLTGTRDSFRIRHLRSSLVCIPTVWKTTFY